MSEEELTFAVISTGSDEVGTAGLCTKPDTVGAGELIKLVFEAQRYQGLKVVRGEEHPQKIGPMYLTQE